MRRATWTRIDAGARRTGPSTQPLPDTTRAMHADAPTLVITDVEAGVRPVQLRLPFRFGAVTLERCPQLFVRVHARIGGQEATGHAAEMLVPRWFDKRPGPSMAANVAGLVASVQRCRDAYRHDAPATAFGLFARHYAGLMAAGEADGQTALTAAYGQAVIDRAVLDALCRAFGVSFFDALRRNLPGIAATPLLPDLDGWDWSAWLASLDPLRRIALRHTVGLLDPLEPVAADDAGGGPVSLPAVIAIDRPTHFKIKLGGDPVADAARLDAVLGVLDDHVADYRYTLDGNEQVKDAHALRALFDALRPVLAKGGSTRRAEALMYLEQPLPRDASLGAELPWREAPAPLLMDEADGRLSDWPAGAPLGWHGVSSKSCKGLYKAIANRARVDAWAQRDPRAPRCFMSAEDLTCQAGLSVQQDLALAALLGLASSERNGHHYGPGFGTAPADEQRAYAEAHADLYCGGRDGQPPRLRREGGVLRIDSLFAPGFAHRADPDWRAMQPLADAVTLV
jgi:hypothetical protein